MNNAELFIYNNLNFEYEDIYRKNYYLLSDYQHAKLNKYKLLNDKKRSLIGYLLLHKGLLDLNFSKFPLKSIRYNRYNCPFLAENIGFNISHSGNYVICIIGENNIFGIDIEEKLFNIDFPLLLNEICTPLEMEEIINCDDIQEAFFKIWVAKEATTKAEGQGLNIPLKEILVSNHTCNYKSNIWHLQYFDICEQYSSCLVSFYKINQVNLHYINLVDSILE